MNAYIYIKNGPQLIVTNLKSIKSKQGNTSISETTDFSACFFGHKNYIFTGDIVVHNNLKYVVSKKREEEFYYLEKNGKYYCRLSSMEDDYSVIGNIYENKELLEVR